jgi:hypothetical protein
MFAITLIRLKSCRLRNGERHDGSRGIFSSHCWKTPWIGSEDKRLWIVISCRHIFFMLLTKKKFHCYLLLRLWNWGVRIPDVFFGLSLTVFPESWACSKTDLCDFYLIFLVKRPTLISKYKECFLYIAVTQFLSRSSAGISSPVTKIVYMSLHAINP